LASDVLDAPGAGFADNFGGIWQLTDKLSIGGHWLTRKKIAYAGDATFTQVPTGLVVPVTIGTCPACLPAGTPVDAVLAPEFASGGPLANGGVSTSIIMPPQGSIGLAYKADAEW